MNKNSISFTSERGTLIPGNYFAVISEAKVITRVRTGTEQLRLTFTDVDSQKTINSFNGIKGYKWTEDGELVLKNNKPVEDPNLTAKYRRAIQLIGCNAGIPEGSDFKSEDLEGKTVGIVVDDVTFRNGKQYKTVVAIWSVDYMKNYIEAQQLEYAEE